MMATTTPGGWRLLLLRGWLPVTLVALWWTLSAGSEALYFPPLQEILTTLVDEWILGPRWRSDLLPSLANFTIGFGTSVLLGTALGVLLGMSPVMRALFAPVLTFFRSLPSPALIPIVLGILGLGAGMNVSLIVLGAVWPILLNTIDGVRSVDTQLREMVRSYRLSRRQIITHVVLPSAGPQIFAGYRIGLQIAIILIVVSEMVGATHGLGYYVLESQQLFMITQTWVGTILLGIIGYLLTLIFLRIERRVLRWQIRMRQATGAS
ncbi:ABC transporter permease [Phytoactinopolyspora halotolerans]|uniref:ABC transporter permease n=1 Tax=Phytoactinopolyspora halotolerans TaxID=1981512 RepID=A0A6L9S9W4_9ACTN|nr:ABC transporter permease [Phytoactinopolyspora halotolerans]NEE01328.1 ABC transporter permease [Phytoactinopolyspora halotolerans]